MRRIALSGVLVVVIGGLAVGGIAVAAGGPRTDAVIASFDLTPESSKGMTCQGQDGSYNQFMDVFSGTITSADPRLNGDMSMRSRSLLHNDSGYSDIRGVFQVTDDETGAVLVSGHITGIGGPGGVAKALMSGTLPGGGEFLGFVSITTNFETGGIHGDIGSVEPVVTEDFAIIQQGSCHGTS